jgi:hypothetical protein
MSYSLKIIKNEFSHQNKYRLALESNQPFLVLKRTSENPEAPFKTKNE